MNSIITPRKLEGKINIPSDKSFCHRTILSAFLAKGVSVIKNVNMCEDVKNTINIIRQMCELKIENNDLIIDSTTSFFDLNKIEIEESASTLRIMLPTLVYLNKQIEFKLGNKLFDRGIKEYEKFCSISYLDNSIFVKDFIDKKEYKVSLKESSQYASGIIFLASILKHDTKIVLDSIENSIGYIDLTIDILNKFGADIKRENNVITIKQKELIPTSLEAPVDGSLYLYINILNKLGSKIEIENKDLFLSNPDKELKNKLNENEFDLSKNPDSIFCLPLLQLVNKKEIVLLNIDRLKNKESDRIKTLTNYLDESKSTYELKDNKIIIKNLSTDIEKIETYKDHRMIMFGLAVSTVANKEIIVTNTESINKSYKNMFAEFDKIGLNYKNIEDNYELCYKVNDKTTKISSNTKFDEVNNKKVFIVVDKNVNNTFVEELKTILSKHAKKIDVFKLNKDKENIKTLKFFKKITKELLEKEYEKSDYIIAFGGGTVTDLTSFVAANYKRGMNLILIPTTLLSMVDASVGNKNAINFKKIKNSIGTFYSPQNIIINSKYLKTLSEKEKRNGMAEIIKIFSLNNQKMFFDVLDSNPYENLYKWIFEAIKEKIEYITKDPFDKNERKALNFGHTIGHAIELEYKLEHGEAVANGMIKECNNSFIKEAIKKYSFNIVNKEFKKIKEIKNDKKIEDNKIDLVKLEKIGQYTLIKENVDKI